MLPFPPWSEGDQAKCPVQLGLYTADYGSHGVEILHVHFSVDKPNNLLALKITVSLCKHVYRLQFVTGFASKSFTFLHS